MRLCLRAGETMARPCFVVSFFALFSPRPLALGLSFLCVCWYRLCLYTGTFLRGFWKPRRVGWCIRSWAATPFVYIIDRRARSFRRATKTLESNPIRCQQETPQFGQLLFIVFALLFKQAQRLTLSSALLDSRDSFPLIKRGHVDPIYTLITKSHKRKEKKIRGPLIDLLCQPHHHK